MTRIKLSEKYKNEREAICNKIIELVGTEFILSDLDENLELQQKIRALKDDIQKYYAASSLSVYRSNYPEVKRDYLIIIRYIFRENGYNFTNKEHMIHGEDRYIKRTVKYSVQKNI